MLLLALVRPMNSKVLMPSCPLLLAGADVTHQQGFGDTSPSVVAVVASMDRFLTRFAADVFMQGPRVEIIQVRAALCLSSLGQLNLCSCRARAWRSSRCALCALPRIPE